MIIKKQLKKICLTKIFFNKIFILNLFFCGSILLQAQEHNNKDDDKEVEEEKFKEITFSANKITVKNIEKFNEFNLFGDVVINDSDITFKGDQMIVSGEDYSQIKGTGNIVLENHATGMSIKGFRLIYDREAGNLQIFGTIELKNTKEGFIARGDSLEIKVHNEGQPVILRGSVRFFKDKLFARSDLGIYDKKLNTLYLIGNNYIILEDGRVSLSDRTTIDLATNEVSMESDIRRDEVLKNMKVKVE